MPWVESPNKAHFSEPPECRAATGLRWLAHFLEQYLTSSQFFSHFLRHANGRPQVAQSFSGISGFLWAIRPVQMLLAEHGCVLRDFSDRQKLLCPWIGFFPSR